MSIWYAAAEENMAVRLLAQNGLQGVALFVTDFGKEIWTGLSTHAFR